METKPRVRALVRSELLVQRGVRGRRVVAAGVEADALEEGRARPSLVVNDVDAGFTMAYVMNRMGESTVGDDRAHAILRAVYQSLE